MQKKKIDKYPFSAEVLLATGGTFLFTLFFGTVLLQHPSLSSVRPHDVATDDPFLLGQYYFNQDEDQEGPYDLMKARAYYTQALREDPESNQLTWYQLGRIDFIEGKFVSALYKFDTQIEYFGDEIPNVYYMIGLANGFKARTSNDPQDWLQAETGFKKFLEYDPVSPWGRTDLAWIYFAQGKYEEMLPVVEEGLKVHPDHPWLLNMRGLSFLNTERRDEALQDFLRAKEEADKLSPADWGRAYPGNDPNLWDEGLFSFKEAIEKNIALAAAVVE